MSIPEHSTEEDHVDFLEESFTNFLEYLLIQKWRLSEMKYDKQILANRLLEDVGGEPKVFEFKNDYGHVIDIYFGIDSPIGFLNSYSTIGLSEYTLDKKIGDQSLRAEIIGASDSGNEYFPNMISDCAFSVMGASSNCMPGLVFTNIVDQYYTNTEMKHILLLWDMKDIEFDEEYVTWLFAVPISESEYEFLLDEAYQELESLFEKKQIDIYDLNRESVV